MRLTVSLTAYLPHHATHTQPIEVKRVECLCISLGMEPVLNFTAALAQELASCSSSICKIGAMMRKGGVVEDFARISNVSIFRVIRVIRPYCAPAAGRFLAPRGEDG